MGGRTGFKNTLMSSPSILLYTAASAFMMCKRNKILRNDHFTELHTTCHSTLSVKRSINYCQFVCLLLVFMFAGQFPSRIRTG